VAYHTCVEAYLMDGATQCNQINKSLLFDLNQPFDLNELFEEPVDQQSTSQR
jgi:hypothetical protein